MAFVLIDWIITVPSVVNVSGKKLFVGFTCSLLYYKRNPTSSWVLLFTTLLQFMCCHLGRKVLSTLNETCSLEFLKLFKQFLSIRRADTKPMFSCINYKYELCFESNEFFFCDGFSFKMFI